MGLFLAFWGPIELFLRLGYGLKTVLGSNYKAEKNFLLYVRSNLTFTFSLFLGSVVAFGAFESQGSVKQVLQCRKKAPAHV